MPIQPVPMTSLHTSNGASEDLPDPDGRRFLVNAGYWILGLEKHITPDLPVDIVGTFNPGSDRYHEIIFAVTV